jgi:hypothetical protein
MSSEHALSAIELRYPHIVKGLCGCWRKPDCQDYLSGLVFDQRGGRQGFPPEVSAELMFLYNLLERKPGRYDIWREADNQT